MMTGSVRVVSRARSRRQISRPDTPGSIQSRMTRSGAVLGKPQFGLVAAFDALDDIALRFEIVAEQQREIGFVLDDEDARRRRRLARRRCSLRALIHASPPAASTVDVGILARHARPFGGHRLAGDEIDDGLGDIGGVVADPLDVLGAEQQMGAEGDVARILHHVGQEIAEHRILERVEIDVALPHGSRARSASRWA